MQAAQSREFGVLESWNGAEKLDLGGVFQLGLEADHVPQRAQLVILTKLHDGIGPAPLRKLGAGGARIVEPDRLHRAVAQRFDPARCHHLDRHAALEIGRVLLPFAEFGLLAIHQPLVESEVFVLGHRAVDVISFLIGGGSALVPARLHPADVHVDALAMDDGRDGIEERQPVLPGCFDDALRQRLRGQRTGRDDGRAFGG